MLETICGAYNFSLLPTTTLNPSHLILVDCSGEYECFYKPEGTKHLGKFTGNSSATWLVKAGVIAILDVIQGTQTEKGQWDEPLERKIGEWQIFFGNVAVIT